VSALLSSDESIVGVYQAQQRAQVASRVGIEIPISCLSGSCGTCEVEVTKTNPKTGTTSTAVVHACIAGVPRGFDSVTVSQLSDPIWGDV
jgi:ferredoxin